MIEVKKVSKSYKDKRVLNDVSFDITSGTICGLLGVNGAGKSTLMKIMTNLISQYEGEVYYYGEIYNRNFNRESVGAMIENPVFYKDLSGFDNLKLLSELFNDIDDSNINKVLVEVGLFDSKNILFRKYSLGMKQRLYLAYAILCNPRILILDEPFNGIDPITMRLFKELIKKIAENGCTVLVSSHIISDIQTLCSQVIIIDKGSIVYDDLINDETNLEEIFFSKVTDGGIAQ